MEKNLCILKENSEIREIYIALENFALYGTTLLLAFIRDCAGGLFLTGSGDLRACFTECRATTTCNTATIPQEHLLVLFSLTALFVAIILNHTQCLFWSASCHATVIVDTAPFVLL